MSSAEQDMHVLTLCLSAFDEIARVAAESGLWQDLELAISSRKAKCHEAGKHCYFWVLPVATCTVVGGTADQAIPLSAAWILFDMASDILDDIYDQDKPYEPWTRWDAEVATLVSIGALFLAQRLVSTLKCDAEKTVTIQQTLATAGLTAARGQTISTRPQSVQEYFERIGGNTAQVLGTVALIGGQLVTNNTVELDRLYEYGVSLQYLRQFCDDTPEYTITNSTQSGK